MNGKNKIVDIAALELLCDKLDCGSPRMQAIAEQIRKAIGSGE